LNVEVVVVLVVTDIIIMIIM